MFNIFNKSFNIIVIYKTSVAIVLESEIIATLVNYTCTAFIKLNTGLAERVGQLQNTQPLIGTL